MALVFVEKICKCGKTFKTSNDSDLCYDCTLEEISGGNPEEGDFNTAKIRSGTMTEKERRYLQQDLEAVENGRSSLEPDEEGQEWLDWEEEEDEGEEEEEEEDDWEEDEDQEARLGDEG